MARVAGSAGKVRIALVSRELYPATGGGIGQSVSAAASILARVADVSVLTSSNCEPAYRELERKRDPRLPPKSVRVAFVQEPSPEEAKQWSCHMHYYSARAYQRLRELYPEGGPHLIEFPDYQGEGFVTVQAKETHDPFLADTQVCLRAQTTAELSLVLNAYLPRDLPARATRALERYCLARADWLIWPGGDVLKTYERFYGKDALARAVRIPYPYRGPRLGPASDSSYTPGSPLRLLYIGRLERRKGVHNLLRAACALDRDDFRLTLLGTDTNTGPLGVSMRALLELEAAGDGRITIASPAGGQTGREALFEAIRASDVVVIPSLWECGPYTALEALCLNRPVLATPVGRLVELAGTSAAGWLASGTGHRELHAALRDLLDQRDKVGELIRSGAPAERGRELTSESEVIDGYLSVASSDRVGKPSPPGTRRPSAKPPLVSAIVPYFRAERFLVETLESLLTQTYPRIELVLVNDGSFEDSDWIVAELSARLPLVVVTQMNRGLGAARNLGISQSRGRYFFPLDADNVAEREFVARCVETLERDSELAYVTAWSRYIDEHGEPLKDERVGYQPLGNRADEILEVDNFCGDAAAVVRRRLFDAGFGYSEEMTSVEDWHFYRELRRCGHFGAVIPERLLRYRVREDSMQARIGQPRRPYLNAEIDALIAESAMRWTA